MRHETEIMGHKLVFRTWNYGMKQEALRRATKWARTPSGELEPDVDPWTLNDMLLVQTLVEAMIAYTQGINGVSVEERKKS